MIIRTRSWIKRKGITDFEIKKKSFLARALVINKLTPIGGVQYPIARLTVIISPQKNISCQSVFLSLKKFMFFKT